MPTTQVQILRKPCPAAGADAKAIPLSVLDVDVPHGTEEQSDRVRASVRAAAATFAGVTPARVSVNHREGGGYVAYVPPLEETR